MNESRADGGKEGGKEGMNESREDGRKEGGK